MRDFVLTRLAALVGAVLGTALLLFLFLDVLPGVAGSDRSGLLRFIGIFGGSGEAWIRLGVTLPLALLALTLAAIFGVGLAAASLSYRHKPLGRIADALAAGLSVVPPFWLGLLLGLLFAGLLRLLPASGFVPWSNPAGALASLLMPALALGLPHAGQLAGRIRGGTPEPPPAQPSSAGPRDPKMDLRAAVLSQLPQALARTFGALLLGAVLVESVFYLPGLGRLVLGAAEQHDAVSLRGGLFVLSLVAAVGMFGLALLRLVVDPEVRR